MPEFKNIDARAVKMALAADAYRRDHIRIVAVNLSAYRWLVATHSGVFAVAQDQVCTAINGWFFGVCRHGEYFYLFENCGLRDRTVDLGRIVRVEWVNGRLANPAVLVRGLHTNCHQIRVIDGLLCVVDTANQAIRRYTLAGELVDIKTPFPVAPSTDQTGQYLHINSIAKIGARIVLMLHNGKVLPEKPSELAWLDEQWNLLEITPLDGRWCHDIVLDDAGTRWHCASQAGQLINSDGLKIPITEGMLTRGLLVSNEHIVVGASSFGPRQRRDGLGGNLVILDRNLNRLANLHLDSGPTDIASL